MDLELHDPRDYADVMAAVYSIEREGSAVIGMRILLSNGHVYQVGWVSDGLIGQIIKCYNAQPTFEIISPRPFRFPEPTVARRDGSWVGPADKIPEPRPGLFTRLLKAVCS